METTGGSVSGPDHRRRKRLGQYFTPPLIVEFMFDAVMALSEGNLDRPRVVDPACGQGAFLQHALDHGFTRPEELFGVEHDPHMHEAWEKSGLQARLGDHLYVQDGLADTPDGEVSPGLFDLVIGNPPFGLPAGDTLQHAGAQAVFRGMRLWRHPKDCLQEDLPSLPNRPLTRSDRERLARFPIEILFLERFVDLAKPGGQIAVILPDGVLSNARYQYVRNWTQRRCRLQAIVGLRADAFRGSRAAARTSILFCRRRHEPEGDSDADVCIATLPSVGTRADFEPVLAAIIGPPPKRPRAVP
jgi:type I restriction enzyme M protein